MTRTAENNYYHFFGINTSPFSIAPDPHYLFLGEKHQEALAHLFYGIGNEGGFIVLTGEVGTGKTTICRTILQQMPDDTDVAYIVNPRQDANELLESICDELGLFFDSDARSNKQMLDIINKFLLASHARGRHTLLIIDEAQNLSADVLEQIRLLTNLETNEKKLLQLVLIGQPELADMLAARELRQLSQRVTARYHLETLTCAETGKYVEHRLRVAGFHGTLFSPAALRRVYRATGGVPRLINVLCERCLLGAYVSESRCIDAAIVKRAARELKDPERKSRRLRRELGKFDPRRWAIPAFASLVAAVTVHYATMLYYAAPAVHAAEPTLTSEQDAATQQHAAIATSPSRETVEVETLAPSTTDSRERGLQRLAERWSIDVDSAIPVCEAVVVQGLSCLEVELSAVKIARLGLPGIVETGGGRDSQYRLLDTTTAMEHLGQAGNRPIRFITFWRSPPIAATSWPWTLGDEHEGVQWLQQRLNWYQGKQFYWVDNGADHDSGAVRDRFDWMSRRSPALQSLQDRDSYGTQMQDAVKDLQQQLGWQATGEGDLLTLVKLDSLTNSRAPSLVHSG